MMKSVFLAALMCSAVSMPALAQPPTAPMSFVAEYVREVGQLERLRQHANDEMADASNQMANCVRNMTRMQLELQFQSRQMKGMVLAGEFSELPGQIAAVDNTKADLYRQFADGCAVMLAGPKPGVDYGQITADLPKITAQLDYEDSTLLQATTLLFAMLIDMRADSKGSASHLLITKSERAELLNILNRNFGDKLDQKNPNNLVGSMALLRDLLMKDYKAADEPW